jgi:hypothetical protein
MEVPNMQITRVTLNKYIVGVVVSLIMREAQAKQEAE